MALVDDVHIEVKAGDGGNGAKSIKQLFGSKKTSADGGNGGRGGNVYFQGTSNLFDLSEFQFKKHIKAKNGRNGMNKDLDGRKGEDVTVLVPFGTTIIDEKTEEWVEILNENKLLIARGGTGGMGNHDYKLDTKDFKMRVDEGSKGENFRIHLVLNLIADIGLVGLPNAGKSSLLKKLTNAHPKIGNYPFTTLEPNLGTLGDIVLADIPGLIDGASEGKGLGINFLKHIQKTKALIHCIDATDVNVLVTYKTVRREFASFNPELLQKEELIVLTKKDLVDGLMLDEQIKILKKFNKNVLTISIYDEESLKDLRKNIILLLEKLPQQTHGIINHD